MKKTTRAATALGVTAAAFLGLGLTGTGAWFTDQEHSTVTATAGQLDIDLGAQLSAPVTVSDLLPGVEQGPYTLNVVNPNVPNSTEVKYRIRTENETSDQAAPSALMDVMRVRLVHGFCDGAFPGNVNPTFETTKKVTNLTFDSQTSAIGDGNLDPNNTHCFALYFSLPSSAGNDYKGSSGSFDIVVDATQPQNPGWSE